MATGKELKKLAKRRLKTAKFLIDKDIPDMAAYIMGYALECALKSVICKTLHLEKYPEDKGGQFGYFLVHNFVALQRLAGLEYVFKADTPEFRPWSEFIAKYSGDWTKMRYEIDSEFKTVDVELLYACLNGKTGEEGVFQIFSRLRKW